MPENLQNLVARYKAKCAARKQEKRKSKSKRKAGDTGPKATKTVKSPRPPARETQARSVAKASTSAPAPGKGVEPVKATKSPALERGRKENTRRVAKPAAKRVALKPTLPATKPRRQPAKRKRREAVRDALEVPPGDALPSSSPGSLRRHLPSAKARRLASQPGSDGSNADTQTRLSPSGSGNNNKPTPSPLLPLPTALPPAEVAKVAPSEHEDPFRDGRQEDNGFCFNPLGAPDPMDRTFVETFVGSMEFGLQQPAPIPVLRTQPPPGELVESGQPEGDAYERGRPAEKSGGSGENMDLETFRSLQEMLSSADHRDLMQGDNLERLSKEKFGFFNGKVKLYAQLQILKRILSAEKVTARLAFDVTSKLRSQYEEMCKMPALSNSSDAWSYLCKIFIRYRKVSGQTVCLPTKIGLHDSITAVVDSGDLNDALEKVKDVLTRLKEKNKSSKRIAQPAVLATSGQKSDSCFNASENHMQLANVEQPADVDYDVPLSDNISMDFESERCLSNVSRARVKAKPSGTVPANMLMVSEKGLNLSLYVQADIQSLVTMSSFWESVKGTLFKIHLRSVFSDDHTDSIWYEKCRRQEEAIECLEAVRGTEFDLKGADSKVGKLFEFLAWQKEKSDVALDMVQDDDVCRETTHTRQDHIFDMEAMLTGDSPCFRNPLSLAESIPTPLEEQEDSPRGCVAAESGAPLHDKALTNDLVDCLMAFERDFNVFEIDRNEGAGLLSTLEVDEEEDEEVNDLEFGSGCNEYSASREHDMEHPVLSGKEGKEVDPVRQSDMFCGDSTQNSNCTSVDNEDRTMHSMGQESTGALQAPPVRLPKVHRRGRRGRGRRVRKSLHGVSSGEHQSPAGQIVLEGHEFGSVESMFTSGGEEGDSEESELVISEDPNTGLTDELQDGQHLDHRNQQRSQEPESRQPPHMRQQTQNQDTPSQSPKVVQPREAQEAVERLAAAKQEIQQLQQAVEQRAIEQPAAVQRQAMQPAIHQAVPQQTMQPAIHHSVQQQTMQPVVYHSVQQQAIQPAIQHQMQPLMHSIVMQPQMQPLMQSMVLPHQSSHLIFQQTVQQSEQHVIMAAPQMSRMIIQSNPLAVQPMVMQPSPPPPPQPTPQPQPTPSPQPTPPPSPQLLTPPDKKPRSDNMPF